ncbi:MAG TPA: hypothetical protein VF271_10055 [Rhodanobacteraceae bacterium]
MPAGTVEIVVHESAAPEPSGAGPIGTSVAVNGTAHAQQPGMLSNLAYANHVSSNQLSAQSQVANQDALNRLNTSIVAKAVSQIQAHGPATTRASVAILTSDALAQQIAGLKAALQGFATHGQTGHRSKP